MERNIYVKKRAIGPGNPIFVTAEIGSSHMGDFNAAKELLLGAKKAGCDGADLFLAHPEDYYRASAETQGAIRVWKGEELSPEEWRRLFAYAKEIDMIMYLTPLDLTSVRLAVELGSPMLNINSDDVTNLTHLELVASTGLPVTMHDISATLAEVEAAVYTLNMAGCKDITLLHSTLESGDEDSSRLYCTSNLRVMETYRSAFSDRGVLVGCVEHTTSNFLIYAVAAMQPALISKHIIVKHKEGAPDSEISVELRSLQNMVQNVRYVEMALGSGSNCLVTDINGEMSPKFKIRRKVLVAARDIPKGELVEKRDIVAKRPWMEGGLHLWKSRELYGAKTRRFIHKDEVLDFNMFEQFLTTQFRFPELQKRRF